jgi:DNA-binding CsgD family transcriptional regulator
MAALDEWFDKLTILSSVEGKIARFCVEYALSPQQSRVVEAMLHGALSNEALGCRLGIRQWTLRKHLDRIAQKTMTRSRTELLYLFYEGRRGE